MKAPSSHHPGRQALTVFRKESIETLRDRRTLFAMIFIPLLLLPGLFLIISLIALFFYQKAESEAIHYTLKDGPPETVMILQDLFSAKEHWVEVPHDSPREAIANRDIQVAIHIPAGFSPENPGEDANQIHILFHEGDLRSTLASEQARQILSEWRQTLIREKGLEAGLSPGELDPFVLSRQNVAAPSQVTGGLLGGLLPYLVIMLCLTGAAYPAIDLTAGEKERGTIETILSSPVDRRALVLGKFLVVFSASLITALLALFSMGLSLLLVPSLLIGGGTAPGGNEFPLAFHLPALAGIFFLILPLGAIFSALLLFLGIIARSYREAQSYLSPVFLIALLPAIIATLPGVQISPLLLSLPIVNVCLISREMLLGTFLWGPAALVILSNLTLAALALAATSALFKKESVLFRY